MEEKDKEVKEKEESKLLQAEITEFTGLPPVKEGEQKPSPPEVSDKPPVEASTPEGAKKEVTPPPVEPPPVKEEITLEQITKLQTQIENLHKAIASERGEKKHLREELETAKMELETLKKSGEIATEITDIDPDMEKIVLPILEKREQKRKQEEEEKRKKQAEEEAQALVELWTKNYQEVKAKHPDFDELVRQYFDPAVKYDEELNKKLLASENPAEFAYQEAIKIKEKLLKPAIDEAVKKTKEEVLKELKTTGQSLPVSLSNVPGGSPPGEALNSQQKEISEFIK